MAYWLKWLSEMSPSWAAYRALMMQGLVVLDKQPGGRPVSIGEIWQCLLAKLVMEQAGEQVQLACNSLQLCVKLASRNQGNTP